MIKNLKYIGIALATLFVACDDDDYTDWADPQSNEPEALQTASFSVSYDEDYVFDLADIEEGTESVQLFTPVTAVEAGATDFTYKVILSAEGNKIEIAADENGYVKVADLQAAIETIYGKAPETREVSATVYCYFSLNGVTYRCSNTASIPVVQVQLDSPTIENTYYLIGNYVGGGWNADGLLEFNHSSSDVYEDPVFTVTFEVIEAEQDNDNSGSAYIKVVPQSAYDETTGDLDWNAMLVIPDGYDRVYNSYTDGFTAPLVVATEAGDNTIEVDDPGKYRVTINMMDYTISIEQLGNFSDFLYLPGATSTSWGFDQRIACEDGNGDYSGFIYFGNNEFKFTPAADWNNGEYTLGDFVEYSDIFSGEAGSNISVTGIPGLMKIEADLVNQTLTGAFVDAVYISGGNLVDGTTSWDKEYTMTLENDGTEYYYTATVVSVGSSEFKFCDSSWTNLDLGGSFDNLTYGGGNLYISDAGTYIINLYPTRVTKDDIYCTVTPAE